MLKINLLLTHLILVTGAISPIQRTDFSSVTSSIKPSSGQDIWINSSKDAVYNNLVLKIDQLIIQNRLRESAILLEAIAFVYPSNMQNQLCLLKAKGDYYTAVHLFNKANVCFAELSALLKIIDKDYALPASDYFFNYNIYRGSSKLEDVAEKTDKVINELLMSPLGSQNTLATSRLYLYLFKLNSIRGSYQSAFHYYRHYTLINDSVLSIAKINRVRVVQAQFTKHIRPKLHSSNTVSKQSEGFNNIYQYYILWSFLMLMVLLLTVCGYRWRRRIKKSNLETVNFKSSQLAHLLDEQELLMAENEQLLKEAHHKIRNSFQMVMSLLNSQSKYLSDEAAISAIDDSHHRLQSMVIMHQKLYGVAYEDLIGMKMYVNELLKYLVENLDELSLRSAMHINVDDFWLDGTQAALVGLFIGEAISRVIKFECFSLYHSSLEINFRHNPSGKIELLILYRSDALLAGKFPYDLISLGVMDDLKDHLGGELTIFKTTELVIDLKFQRKNEVENYELLHQHNF